MENKEIIIITAIVIFVIMSVSLTVFFLTDSDDSVEQLNQQLDEEIEEIIYTKILSGELLSEELISEKTTNLCGDGVCDNIEKHSKICPEDCGGEESRKPKNSELCGDGICQNPELKTGLCPEDCEGENRYDQNNYEYLSVDKENSRYDEVIYSKEQEFFKNVEGVIVERTNYFVTNPSTGSKMEVVVFHPEEGDNLPGMILVEGGNSGMSNSLKFDSSTADYSKIDKMAAEGFVILIFSAEGREGSEGEENYNGYLSQDGLYELYRFLSQHEKVDYDNIGLVSKSYGVAMVSGMLGRYQVPVKYFIEWEGPVNRYYVTVGCNPKGKSVQTDITCNDDDYWIEREALRFVPYFNTDNLIIIQSEIDHVQSSIQHSIDINNLAIDYIDNVRVNGPENEAGIKYTSGSIPLISEDEQLEDKILEYMIEFSS